MPPSECITYAPSSMGDINHLMSAYLDRRTVYHNGHVYRVPAFSRIGEDYVFELQPTEGPS